MVQQNLHAVIPKDAWDIPTDVVVQILGCASFPDMHHIVSLSLQNHAQHQSTQWRNKLETSCSSFHDVYK